MPSRRVWVIVMGHVVNLVLLKELWRDDPGSFGNYFVCPLAVTDTLASVTPQGLRG